MMGSGDATADGGNVDEAIHFDPPVTDGPLTPESWAARLARLKELVAGDEPPDLVRYLTLVHGDSALIAGSGVPALTGGRLQQLRSGLWVPADVDLDPGPEASVLLFVTGEDVFGLKCPAEVLAAMVATTSLAETLLFVGEMLRRVHAPGASHRQVDEQFVQELLVGPPAMRARAALRDPRRILVSPQALSVLLRLSCELSPPYAAEGAQPRIGQLVVSLLAIADHLGPEDLPEDVDPVELRAWLYGDLVRNHAFNARPEEMGLLASFTRRWREIAAPECGGALDLDSAYELATGVPLRDVNAVAFLLWSLALADGPLLRLDGAHAVLGWEEPRLSRALELFVVDLDEFRDQMVRENADLGIEWAHNTPTHRPVVRLPAGLVVIDPLLALQRGYSWAVLLSDVRESGERGPAMAETMRTSLDKATEAFVLETLAAIVGDLGRLYTERDLQRAYGSRKHTPSTGDAVLDYGDAWVVVEATTQMLRRTSLAGGTHAELRDDLGRYVRKIRQIHSTISLLRSGRVALTGGESPSHQRFYPLLVLEDGFPVNLASLSILRDAASGEGLLQGDDVAPLEVVTLEDLSLVQALQEQGGPSLRDLLQGKQDSGMRDMDLRSYVHRTLRANPTRADDLRRAYRAAFAEAVARLGIQGDLPWD